MQARKTKEEPNITEAAEKTSVIIRELQSRLLEHDPAGDILERQLQAYFEHWPGEDSPSSSALNRIRDRVIGGVAERILRGWERSQDGKSTPFEKEVIDRLIDAVLDTIMANGYGPGRNSRGFSTEPKSAA